MSYEGFSLHESSGIALDTPGTVVSTIDELDIYQNKMGWMEKSDGQAEARQTRKGRNIKHGRR